jgi:hypothetical protein
MNLGPISQHKKNREYFSTRKGMIIRRVFAKMERKKRKSLTGADL